MSTTQVIIIRHGEKPGDPEVDNAADGADLSLRGYQRAGALAPYIPGVFGKPDFLFAAQASKHSNRPVETITPLANTLQLAINDKHADDDYGKVADDILKNSKYAGKRVLICWHHGKIPELAAALGGIPAVQPWPGTVFDRVWIMNCPAGGGKDLAVQNLPQRLLYGDSAD